MTNNADILKESFIGLLFFMPKRMLMRYYYEKPSIYFQNYGITYECDHPVYSKCTLYLINNKGLAVIQQRYDELTKHTYWTELDPWLVDELYLSYGFEAYFKKYSATVENGLYPTVTVRQIMWALKKKPIRREPWETVFDRHPF